MSFVDSSSAAGTDAISQGIGFTSGVLGAIANDPSNFAVSLGGPSSLDCGPLAALQSSQKFAIELWVQPTTLGPNAQVLASNLRDPDGGATAGVAVRIEPSGKVQLSVGDGISTFTATTANPIKNGYWTHLAISYDASTVDLKVKIWIDGSSTALDTAGVPVRPAGGEMRLGASAAGPDQQYTGLIDEVALYPHSLVDADIQAHLAALTP